MRTLFAFTVAMALASTSALACPWNKSASLEEENTLASSTAPVVEEEAMSTFDPQNLKGEEALQEPAIKE